MASTYGIVGRVGVLVSPSFDGVQKKVRDGLGKPLAQEAPKQGVNLGDAIVNGTTRAFKVGGLAAGAALGAAITKGFGRLRAMEDATAKIEGLGYAAQDVDQIMTDVQGALDGTMFLYSEGANVAAGALAAGVEQGAELEAYLRLTADAATQAGIDFNSMGEIMNRVEGDGRLMGDTVQQLAENGVYVLPALAEEFNVTGEEMRKMVSNGEVDAATFRRIMEEQYGGSSERAAETMSGAMSLAWTAVGQLGERLIAEVYPYLRDFFQDFYQWVQDISPAVEDFGKRVGEALGNIIGWIKDNPGVVKGFAAAIGMVFSAMAAYTIVTKVTNAFKGLNIVMSLNPVGAWIAAIAALVAGLVMAYNNVDWFRNAVQVAWDAITTAFTWAWENVIQPVINWIGDAWNWLADTFMTVWENYLSPVFESIATVATWLWENVLRIVFTAIGLAFATLFYGMQLVWQTVLQPVFNDIGAVATWLWEAVLSPVFTWIGDHWEYVLLGMQLYWETVLKPVWDAIAVVATWLWENVLSPVFTWIGNHWDAILLGMQIAWNEILKPTWDRLVEIAQWLWNDILEPIFRWIGNKWSDMSDRISNTYNDYIKPIFDGFGETVEWIQETFEKVVAAVEEEWDKLKKITAVPINFVIETVYNDGIRKLFNNMVETFGLDDWKLSKMSPVEFAGGGYTGAGGKYDPAGIVHAGEFVLSQAATNRLMDQFGLSGLNYMNMYGQLPPGAGYATGGLVTPVRGPLTSRFGSRWGSIHSGVDWAVPTGTSVAAALAGTVARAGWNVVPGRTGLGMLLSHEGNRHTYYGHLSRLIASVGDQVAKGAIIALSGNTGNSTGPHLHFETWTGGQPVDPLSHMGGLPASATAGGFGAGQDPTSLVNDFIAGIISSVTSRFDGDWAEASATIMRDVSSAGVDAATEFAMDAASAMSSSGGNLGGFLGNLFGRRAGREAGTQHLKDQVRDVAARYGWGAGSQWDALDKLIQRESSWRLYAKNPNSSAEGLFQKMTSIHGPVGSTASQQAEWGLNYIWNRYGNPMNALLHQRNLGYYADGGLVQPDRFMVRDRGGVIPPGLNMVLNGTGRDEYALTGAHMDTLVDSLANRGPAVNIENAYALSTEALARDIETSRRRAAALAPVL